MSIPLPVAGGKVSFSNWPKNNRNDQDLSNKEKVLNKFSNKYHPYNKVTENKIQDFQIDSEENKNNEYVSSFLSKLPIYKSQSPKKSSNLINNRSYEGSNYYKGLDGQSLDDGPPRITLDEISSSPEKQSFSQKIKTIHYLPQFYNPENNNDNNNNNSNNKLNFFGKKNSQYNNNNSISSIDNNIKSSQKNNILNIYTNIGINKNLNSIVVYGYPSYLENEIIQHFKEFGEISSYEIQENNWTLITYRNSYSARNALKHENIFMFKNNIIGVMAHYDYLKLINSNQLNMPSTSNGLPSLNNLNSNTINSINSSNNQIETFNNNSNNNNNNLFNNDISSQSLKSTSTWNDGIFNESLDNNQTLLNRNIINSSPNRIKINSNSPQHFNSHMSIDVDINQKSDFSSTMNMNSNSIKSFDIQENNNTNNLLKKNTVRFSLSNSADSPSQFDNILNNSTRSSPNNSMNVSPLRNDSNSNSIGDGNSTENHIFRSLFTSDTHKKINKLSDLTPAGTKFNPNLISMDYKDKDMTASSSSSSIKPTFSQTNPFAKMLNEEEMNFDKKENKPTFTRKSNIFHQSKYSSRKSLNASITIPKIGNNKITKPSSSSNVKNSHSSLLGKMVELVFGW
jgi:hypothetical protein